MKKIPSKELINRYIDEFHLQQYMDTPLADIAELVVFERDEYLIRVTEVSRYFYFLVSGKVMCFSYANSDRYGCVGYLQPVAMLGESASLWNDLPTANVKALSECTCIAISFQLYRQTLLKDLRFLQSVCHVLASRMNKDGLVYALIEPLDTRLAKFILQNSHEDLFTQKLNDCAEILNTSYRHLLRTLKKFCEENALVKVRFGYRILDRKKLEKTAGKSSSPV